MSYRIAIGSIFTECNHFTGVPIELSDFQRNELRHGDEVLSAHTGTVGGMLDVLRETSQEVVPLVVASTCPGGTVSAVCYSTIKQALLSRLMQSLPVDGVLLALHGSATAENDDYLEGDLILAVREIVGPGIPIVVTLDLHAHVTEAMVSNANAILAWETYPHRDAHSTGVRGARLLLRMLEERCQPTMAMAKVPLIVTAIHGSTDGSGPFADCMRFTKSLEQIPKVLSTSLFLVHPYIDLPNMGGGGLVITDNEPELAERLATQIAEIYWSRRFDLEPTLYSPESAIQMGIETPGGPILLIETADCCGGGACGDSVATLRALIKHAPCEVALVPVVDPAAASECHSAGLGATVNISLGHHLDPRWGKPIQIRGNVIRLTDGKFVYSGGIWGGQTGEMGPSAVVEVGAIQILIASHPTYDWNDEQYQSVRLDARSAKFVVAKNPMNYNMAYGSFAKRSFVLDTPGPTPATLRHVEFKNLSRPYFPLDSDIPALRPSLYRSHHSFQ